MEVMRNMGLTSLHLREGREHKMGLWDAGCICFLTCMCVCMLIHFSVVSRSLQPYGL